MESLHAILKRIIIATITCSIHAYLRREFSTSTTQKKEMR